jgi:stage III sporulation protein SpoIIIAA
MQLQKVVTDDLDALLDVLPAHIRQAILRLPDRNDLLEIVLDLGRHPEARYTRSEVILGLEEVTSSDIEHMVSRIGVFSGDNRAGIERTLHRISAIRNREGKIVGLTCRVGRAVFGTVSIIRDLVETGKSVLLLGRPGVGKTTMLREVARVLADDFKKRVIVVDTSNEIAGDGDIPHPAIGHARRMQVPSPTMQHAVMIEAVENHMPEVIIIDEIGTSLEADAARTIAERGVQLIGTAHGNSLKNIMMNPTLSDLIGGIQTVTLGDEEARRRHTQKSILERKAPPTFDIVVEMQERDRVIVHSDVAEAVDVLLQAGTQKMETRWLDQDGIVRKGETILASDEQEHNEIGQQMAKPIIYLFGINSHKLEEVAREKNVKLSLTNNLKEANLFLTTKNYYRRKPQKIRDAEAARIPIYALKSNNAAQLRHFIETIYMPQKDFSLNSAMEEAEQAIDQVRRGTEAIELSPQNAYVRRLQHMLVRGRDLSSQSSGKGSQRRVTVQHKQRFG